jgi:hypothetical protein
MRRINPIGGIIGENGMHGTPVGSRGVSPSDRIANNDVPYGQTGGPRSTRREREESQWDPNNPWETAVGVDPVVMPPSEQRVDPGPAIGLS